MSNVTPFRYSGKKALTLETKQKNDSIVYKLYKKGLTKYNPYKNFKNNIIEVPKICFQMGQAYKVGV
jgi:hypothetical protein